MTVISNLLSGLQCNNNKIIKLHRKLMELKIEHEYVKCFDGTQVIIYHDGERKGDFIEHQYSHGLEGSDGKTTFDYMSVEDALEICKMWYGYEN